MPTEHAGGTPHLSFESASSPKGDFSTAIATVDFDFSKLDSDEELLQECVDLHLDMRPTLHKIIEREVSLAKSEAVASVIVFILDADDPRGMAMQLSWACGNYISSGISMPQMAKQLGISKQAFQQRDRRIHEMLHLRKTRCMRSEEAKANMRVACRGKGSKAKLLFIFNMRAATSSMGRYLKQQVGEKGINTWSKLRRRTMRLELQPIVDIHSQL
jgi:hypothetical protein